MFEEDCICSNLARPFGQVVTALHLYVDDRRLAMQRSLVRLGERARKLFLRLNLRSRCLYKAAGKLARRVSILRLILTFC